jgi:hypothetical protein
MDMKNETAPKWFLGHRKIWHIVGACKETAPQIQHLIASQESPPEHARCCKACVDAAWRGFNRPERAVAL